MTRIQKHRIYIVASMSLIHVSRLDENLTSHSKRPRSEETYPQGSRCAHHVCSKGQVRHRETTRSSRDLMTGSGFDFAYCDSWTTWHRCCQDTLPKAEATFHGRVKCPVLRLAGCSHSCGGTSSLKSATSGLFMRLIVCWKVELWIMIGGLREWHGWGRIALLALAMR
jgi:hypothetical protein